jgi:hypothetical protein
VKLWHVSERSDIKRFDPRPPPGSGHTDLRPVVWAIAASHISNYLLPQDCPRVCMRVAASTSLSDVAKFLDNDLRATVIVIETAWSERPPQLPYS